MHQTWTRLAFLHWRVPFEELRRVVPGVLPLDTFDGSAWVGIAPFQVTGLRPRFLPALPWISYFSELNLRTYVTVQGRPGVYFFSLDAANPIAVRAARKFYKLPYFDARMACLAEGNLVSYQSRRTHPGAPPAEFRARYRPAGEVFISKPGSLEHFLTARFCLYTVDSLKGNVWRCEIDHEPWPLQPAQAELIENTLAKAHGICLPDEPPHLLFSRRIGVKVWPLLPADARRAP